MSLRATAIRDGGSARHVAIAATIGVVIRVDSLEGGEPRRVALCTVCHMPTVW